MTCLDKWLPSDKYCYSCGDKVLECVWIWAYDCDSGEPKTDTIYKCLNRRWWQLESHPVTESEAYVLQG